MTIPIKLYNQLVEAHRLNVQGLNIVRDTAKCIKLAKQKEVCALVDAWTRPDLFRLCLDDAENSLFRIYGKKVFDVAPILVESLTDVISNNYDSGMRKGYRKVTKEKQIAHEQSRRQQIL